MEILGELSIFRGDSYPLDMFIKDKGSQTYIDITGYTFTMSVDIDSDPINSDNQLFSVEGVVDPDQVLNMGKVSFIPTDVDTNQTPETYYYDIQMVNGSGHKRTIAKDKFIVTQDITKT